jgi:hypothetical protein
MPDENQQPLTYVTFTEPDGTLDGFYLNQVPPEEHVGRLIVLPEDPPEHWTSYKANATRDGLELLPPVVPPAPTEGQIVAGYMGDVQRHMDATAVTFGYDNLLSVVSYADEAAVPRYQTEGQAFRAWRSKVWAHCEQVKADVDAGTRTAPTSEQLISELPALGIEPSPSVQSA